MLTVVEVVTCEVYSIIINFLHQHAIKFVAIVGYKYTENNLINSFSFPSPYQFGCTDSQGTVSFDVGLNKSCINQFKEHKE